jgi:putative transposase
MRQIYLQKQFYQLAKHPPVQITEKAKYRLGLLTAWEALRKQGVTGE